MRSKGNKRNIEQTNISNKSAKKYDYYGKITYYNNYIYEGDCRDDKRHGKGTLICHDGSIYEGDWIDNDRHGNGNMTYTNGSLYEGDFVDGLKHGSGVMWNTDRSVYKGEFKSDQRHGQGIEWSSSGVRRIVDNNMRLFGFRTSMPQGLGARTQMTEPALAPPRPAPLANQSLLF